MNPVVVSQVLALSNMPRPHARYSTYNFPEQQGWSRLSLIDRGAEKSYWQPPFPRSLLNLRNFPRKWSV